MKEVVVMIKILFTHLKEKLNTKLLVAIFPYLLSNVGQFEIFVCF